MNHELKELKTIYTDYIPPDSELEQDNIYISKKFGTSTHLCACGCGEKVVLPFITSGSRENTEFWTLYEQDEKVTFKPSVGNYSLDCKSHYWINDSTVIWCR